MSKTLPPNKPNDPQLSIFYNTTHMSESELMIRRVAVSRQNTQILRFFQDNPQGYFTPFEVQKYANLGQTPITSIRRAINTLTDAGLLIKTDRMKEGEYGAMNHTWTLA